MRKANSLAHSQPGPGSRISDHNLPVLRPRPLIDGLFNWKTTTENTMTEQLFELGQMVATPAALHALEESNQTPLDFIKRHAAGDWGECCAEDAAVNDEAVWNEERVFSVYETAKGTRIYCITEADRSSTCVLLPSDY